MIDIRKLKELVRLMVENELTELDLRDSEEQVTMRRPNPNAPAQVFSAPGMPHFAHAMPAPVAVHGGNGSGGPRLATGEAGAPTSPANDASDDAGLIKIASPMVGTFYATPNPDSPPFATVGTPVSQDKVVCIIEAMKIFNEIKAECTGTIHKVMVKSGQAVEFGQTLFLVKPS